MEKRKILLILLLIANILAILPCYCEVKQQEKKLNMEIIYENAQIVDHPVLGILVLSKDRWRNWIIRSLIIISVFIALTVLNFSLPKNHEANIIVSYFLSGSMFIVSLWEMLSGWMLTRLNKNFFGLIFIFVSIPMYILTYIILKKAKQSDISFSTLKESFQKLSDTSKEDKRLSPVSGAPGDWIEEDLIR